MDRRATVLILMVLLGCSGPPASGPIQVTRSQRGDTVGEEMARVHPWVWSRRPELAPALRGWDVFSREGVLEKTVRLPSTFDPRVVRGDTVMGFHELPTGEITIARVDLTGKTME